MSKTYLDARSVLAAEDFLYADVECPEWGGSLRVRGLTAGEHVVVTAPAGVKAFRDENLYSYTTYLQGSRFIYTGMTHIARNGFTYCYCLPESAGVWVAVHDGETQLLDNLK